MLTNSRRPPLDISQFQTRMSYGEVDLHNGQRLEEVVLRKVPVLVVFVQGPEVVDHEVEDGQDNHQHYSAELCLEAHNHHDAGDKTECANKNSAKAPLAGENESDEQEDEKYPSGELDIHLAIFLVDLGKTCWRKLLAHPAIGQYHE